MNFIEKLNKIEEAIEVKEKGVKKEKRGRRKKKEEVVEENITITTIEELNR